MVRDEDGKPMARRLWLAAVVALGMLAGTLPVPPASAAPTWSNNQGVNAPVYAIAMTATKAIIGGTFSRAGASGRYGIAQQSFGAFAWDMVGVGLGTTVYPGPVYALVTSGTTTYAGGSFQKAGAATIPYLAKYDGSQWSGLGSGVNGEVDAIAVSGSNVYVGGSFTTAGGSPVSSIAVWNGTTWSGLGTGITGTVRTLAVDSAGGLIAGGDFTTAGGVAANNIARWDGSAWSALGTGMNGTVWTVVTSGTDMYAGGDFTSAGGTTAGRVARWDGSAWSALGAGMNGTVRAMTVTDGGLLLATGSFTEADGVLNVGGLAAWPGTGWQRLANGGLNGSGEGYAIAASGAKVYVGGSFTGAGGTGSSATNVLMVTVRATPTFTSISPAVGTSLGGTTVTITGTWFAASASSTSVTIGGSTCGSVTVVSKTTLTCTTPTGLAGSADVRITVASSVSQMVPAVGAYLYLATPTVTAVSPASGSTLGGSTLTLTGTSFDPSGTSVSVGGSACTSVNVTSTTTLTCTAPSHAAGGADVVVTTSVGSVTSAAAFTYLAIPTVAGIAPASGPTSGGTTIAITGTEFVIGATTVDVGGLQCTSVVVTSATSLTCDTPAQGAGAADVTVTTADGAGTSSGGFTYVSAPTATAVSPALGSTLGGTTITVTGTGFVTGATSVDVGGLACTSVTVTSATSLTCDTASHSAGATDVVVTTTGGAATLTAAFEYVVPTGTVSPAAIPVSGGPIAVTAGTFSSQSSVTVGGLPCGNVVIMSATVLTCDAPALPAGSQQVAVTDGATTLALAFVTVLAPVVPLAEEPVVVLPSNIVQAVAAPLGGCPLVVRPDLDWSGTPSTGWTLSWQSWVNGGAGGPVCTRTLRYDPRADRWVVSS